MIRRHVIIKLLFILDCNYIRSISKQCYNYAKNPLLSNRRR